MIDLARVGSGAGPPLDAVADLANALPGVAIYAGGGVRDDADLRALEVSRGRGRTRGDRPARRPDHAVTSASHAPGRARSMRSCRDKRLARAGVHAG